MDKSQFELGIVSAIVRAMPALRQRRWIASPNREVDVLIAARDGGTIAAEVTRLHPTGREGLREWEGARANIIRRALLQYEAYDLPGVEVVVFWSAWTSPIPAQSLAATELAEFVRRHLPAPGEVADFDAVDDPPPKLPRGIDRIQVRRFLEGPNHWHAPEAGSPSDVTPEQIEERLAAKRSKPKAYTGSYSERWLLLALGAEGLSTWGHITSAIAGRQYATSFDRVFVVKPPAGAVELTTVGAV